MTNYDVAQLKKELQNERLPALKEAGLIQDARMIEYLESYRESYEPGQAEHHKKDKKANVYYNSEQYVRIIRREISKNLSRAVTQGNKSIINHAIGLSSDDRDDLAKWEILRDLFRRKPKYTEQTNKIFQCIIYSSKTPPTGKGKSNFGYYLIDIAKTVYPNIEVFTNNETDSYTTVSQHWEEIEDTIRETEGESIMLIDEGAQFLQYADQSAGKDVSKMMKLLRKNRCHLILIAHTGADIPKDIRRQMFFVDKKSQKKAELGYGVDIKGDNVEVNDTILRLNSIPEAKIQYDDMTDEGIEILFDEKEDGEEEQEEQKPRCQADTNDGNDCPADAKLPTDDPIVCKNHRNKLDDLQ